MKKWAITVVPHTHWDKEWYFTKQDSDVILIKNIQKYLECYKQNPNFYNFTYDGQSSIIDDYLSYYNQDYDPTLFTALKNKKLIIGPWYTQPDFFNGCSETITRNLLVGINSALDWNADYLRIAYVPDSFGHNAQMPQIFQQFNLTSFVYWRGIHENNLIDSTVHWWEGVDGTKVLAYNFYFGYWPMGMYFPYQDLTLDNIENLAKNFLTNFHPILETLKLKLNNVTNNLLIPLGGDQAPVTELLSEFIQMLDRLDPEHNWQVSDYDTYFNTIEFKNLSTINGELKSPYLARIHKTIGSQRADIKIKNKRVEWNLFNRLEPLATYFYLQDGEYPSTVIKKILKLLLECQAHDSLGNCNSDITNADILNRLNHADDLIMSLQTQLLKNIAKAVKLQSEEFIIFNPKISNMQNKTNYKITIFTETKLFKIINVENNQPCDYIVVNQKFSQNGQDVILTSNGEKSLERSGFYQTTIILNNLNLPLFSINKFKIIPTPNLIKNTLSVIKTDSFENNRWLITVNKNGTLNIYDKLNNIKYKNQFELVADQDAGDSYDYSPLENNQKPINSLLSSVSKINQFNEYCEIRLVNKYKIPKGIREKPVNQLVYLTFIINNNETIQIKIKLKNIAKEIRWRVKSTVNNVLNYTYANQAYCTIKRPINLDQELTIWEKNNWKEKPIPVETNESFVYLTDNGLKTGFITRGNNEYEGVVDNESTSLLLTLFRSVPYLGRDNLLNRPGRASGVNELLIPTPDAELKKDLSFQFYWFSTNNDLIWDLTEAVNTDDIFYQTQKLNPIFCNGDRFLQPKFSSLKRVNLSLNKIAWPHGFVIKAIKKSEHHNSILIRGFNSTDKTLDINFLGVLKFVSQINIVNLLEQRLKNAITNDEINKYQIKTYELVIERSNDDESRII